MLLICNYPGRLNYDLEGRPGESCAQRNKEKELW